MPNDEAGSGLMAFEYFEKIQKEEFSDLKNIYLNSAYLGPSPIRAKKKALKALEKETDPSYYPYSEWKEIPNVLRQQLSRLLKCDYNHIAHHTSVTEVINTVALGFPSKSDDVVVVCDGDFPSNILPWMLSSKQGKHELKFLNKDLFLRPQQLVGQLPKNTRLVNISHVFFNTGEKINLVELGKTLKERDIFFVVDASQSFGGLCISPEELSYIDVLVACTYKWLLGGYGHAFSYFSKNALKCIEQKNANWLVSQNSQEAHHLLNYTLDTLSGARKFDRGEAPNMLLMALLSGSLELIEEIGLNHIQVYNQQLVNYFLKNFLSSKWTLLTNKDNGSNIVCVRSKEVDAQTIEKKLKQEKIEVSNREGNIRISFHFFNNKDHVDRLLTILNSTI